MKLNFQQARTQNEKMLADMSKDDSSITMEVNHFGEKKEVSFILVLPAAQAMMNVIGDPALNEMERSLKFIELFIGKLPSWVLSTPFFMDKIRGEIDVFRGERTREDVDNEMAKLEADHERNKEIMAKAAEYDEEYRNAVLELTREFDAKREKLFDENSEQGVQNTEEGNVSSQ